MKALVFVEGVFFDVETFWILARADRLIHELSFVVSIGWAWGSLRGLHYGPY